MLRACLLRARLLLISWIFPCRLARFELALLFPVRAYRSGTPRTAVTAAGETAAAAPTASGSRDGALHGCAPRHVDKDSVFILRPKGVTGQIYIYALLAGKSPGVFSRRK